WWWRCCNKPGRNSRPERMTLHRPAGELVSAWPLELAWELRWAWVSGLDCRSPDSTEPARWVAPSQPAKCGPEYICIRCSGTRRVHQQNMRYSEPNWEPSERRKVG